MKIQRQKLMLVAINLPHQDYLSHSANITVGKVFKVIGFATTIGESLNTLCDYIKEN